MFDVCLQTYGDLNKMYKLIQDSNFDSVSKNPIIGTTFNYDNSLIFDYAFFNQINGSNKILNTASNSLVVFGEEDLQTIFISEDETTEFTFES